MKIPKDFLLVIPARIGSTRFPRKPLADLNGKPMIIRVVENCLKIAEPNQVVVATDSLEIGAVVQSSGNNFFLTKDSHITGTDRVGEVARVMNAAAIINVQGDEPLVKGSDILSLVQDFEKANRNSVVTGGCYFGQSQLESSYTVPKMVVNPNSMLIYASRSNIPFSHGLLKSGKSQTSTFLRQVCIYVMTKNHLATYCSKPKGTQLERLEDIEILRFLELGVSVQVGMVSSSQAVDTPHDLDEVRRAYSENSIQ